MLKKHFQKILNTAIVLVYVVILAGSLVRMTGSGMGCPDWPKCYGYLIPPTKIEQVQWKANHKYQQGQKIIVNETLYVANNDFTSGENYQTTNWSVYDKHDYAIFNPAHTWIEYINRLATVVFGIPILLLVVCGFLFYKEDKRILFLALATLFSVGFEAWLGKIVVDTNLMPVKITLHVLFVFFIVAFLLAIKFISNKYQTILKDKLVNNLAIAAVIFTLLQVIVGTQLRQYVDVQMQVYNHSEPEKWLQTPPIIFNVHRSFSIVLLAINLLLVWLHKNAGGSLQLINWIGILIIAEAVSGLVLYYLDFPFLSQPIHLVLSSLLFGVQFFCVLRLTQKKA